MTHLVRHSIPAGQNILIGSRAICDYIHVRSIVTLYQWVEKYGFPAIKRPDGRWMSSITAIDEWFFLSAETDYRHRGRSRGSNVRADIALKQAIKQFGPDSTQAERARDRLDRISNVEHTSEVNPSSV